MCVMCDVKLRKCRVLKFKIFGFAVLRGLKLFVRNGQVSEKSGLKNEKSGLNSRKSGLKNGKSGLNC